MSESTLSPASGSGSSNHTIRHSGRCREGGVARLDGPPGANLRLILHGAQEVGQWSGCLHKLFPDKEFWGGGLGRATLGGSSCISQHRFYNPQSKFS